MGEQKTALILLLILCFVLVSTPQIDVAKAESVMIVVPDDYTTIQAAINAANEGDTITVKGGTYYEHVVINKTISLISEEGAIIDASREPTVSLDPSFATWNGITVMANHTVVSGFVIRSAANFGIEIRADYGEFHNNIVENCNWAGITPFGGKSTPSRTYCDAHDNLISNNTVRSNHIGIWLSNDYGNTVIFNKIEESQWVGIYLSSGAYSNMIANNSISKSCLAGDRSGGHGIAVGTESHNNLIVRNTISDNLGDGIRIEEFGTGHGLPYDNLIYHNNFVNNTILAYDSGINNIWDDGYPSGGNYWSNYNGSDANSDGIGDTAYTIDENNQDRYPLMEPYKYSDTGYHVIDFTQAFKDNSGNPLATSPSSFKLTFPNRTTSSPLEVGSYLIPSGLTIINSIIWQGTDVTPDTPLAFDAAFGTKPVKCWVYELTVDPFFCGLDEESNETYSVMPSSWTLIFPNETTVTLSSRITYPQTQTGWYSLGNIVMENEVVSFSRTFLLRKNKVWSPWFGFFTLQSNQTFAFDSNSTIDNPDYNSIDQVLSFTASGPDETDGYTKISFDKSLVANPNNVTVLQDGKQTYFDLTPKNNSMVLSINYTHSIHNIIVQFNSGEVTPIPEFPSWNSLLIVLGALALAVLVAVYNLGLPKNMRNKKV